MKNKKDTRLYDALDYIDSDLIGETADKLMVPLKPKVRRIHARAIALIAAFICLIALAIPVIIKLTMVETTITVYDDPPIHGNDAASNAEIHTQSYD